MVYNEAMKKAIMKYKAKNKEKINAQAKKDYKKIKEDPEKLAKRNLGIRTNRKNKKLNNIKTPIDISDAKEVINLVIETDDDLLNFITNVLELKIENFELFI